MFFNVLLCRRSIYFPPRYRFREHTKNAPPRVNYLGSHLSKLFPLISKEQYGSTWDLNQQQQNGAQLTPPPENKQKTDAEHHETPIITGRYSVHLTCLKHGHATRGALALQQHLLHLRILYGFPPRRQLGFLPSRELLL